MKRIILTGGGTAGHVTPNIALLPRLRELGYDIHYIGSYNGIEKELIEPFGIPYHGISSGKLRRYFSVQNFTDPFRVLKGFREARVLIKDLKPDVIFSKGGFVSVPVVLAGKRSKVPVIIHESDMTPGLANKIAIPSATKVCCNFPETLESLPKDKAVLTGSPIRQELLSGNKIAAMDLCGFTADKPVILVIGGSLGSVVVNKAVREALPDLLKDFQIIHLCGKGKMDESLSGTKGYCQFEYIKDELWLTSSFPGPERMRSVSFSRSASRTCSSRSPQRQAAEIRFSMHAPSSVRASALYLRKKNSQSSLSSMQYTDFTATEEALSMQCAIPDSRIRSTRSSV